MPGRDMFGLVLRTWRYPRAAVAWCCPCLSRRAGYMVQIARLDRSLPGPGQWRRDADRCPVSALDRGACLPAPHIAGCAPRAPCGRRRCRPAGQSSRGSQGRGFHPL